MAKIESTACPPIRRAAGNTADTARDKPISPGVMGEKHLSLGLHLRKARESIGWSIRYAAAHQGLSLTLLSEWERGIPISMRQFQRIMRVYNRTKYKLTKKQGMMR